MVVAIAFWAVSSWDAGNEGSWGDEYMGLSEIIWKCSQEMDFCHCLVLKHVPALPSRVLVLIQHSRKTGAGDYGDGGVVRTS